LQTVQTVTPSGRDKFETCPTGPAPIANGSNGENWKATPIANGSNGENWKATPIANGSNGEDRRVAPIANG
jgi:hypothetical protein